MDHTIAPPPGPTAIELSRLSQKAALHPSEIPDFVSSRFNALQEKNLELTNSGSLGNEEKDLGMDFIP